MYFLLVFICSHTLTNVLGLNFPSLDLFNPISLRINQSPPRAKLCAPFGRISRAADTNMFFLYCVLLFRNANRCIVSLDRRRFFVVESSGV